jgi:hypothetical protein
VSKLARKKPIRNALDDAVGALLVEAGFRKNGSHTWLRHRGRRVDGVQIQQSRYNTADASQMTINLATLIAPFDGNQTSREQRMIRRFQGEEGAAMLITPGTMIRIGPLTETHRDLWYSYHGQDPTDCAAVAAEMADDLRQFGLPWFTGKRRSPPKDEGRIEAHDAKYRRLVADFAARIGAPIVGDSTS